MNESWLPLKLSDFLMQTLYTTQIISISSYLTKRPECLCLDQLNNVSHDFPTNRQNRKSLSCDEVASTFGCGWRVFGPIKMCGFQRNHRRPDQTQMANIHQTLNKRRWNFAVLRPSPFFLVPVGRPAELIFRPIWRKILEWIAFKALKMPIISYNEDQNYSVKFKEETSEIF